MVDELLSAYPHQLSFSEAGLRIMITSHFPPKTRLSMASRMLINEVCLSSPHASPSPSEFAFFCSSVWVEMELLCFFGIPDSIFPDFILLSLTLLNHPLLSVPMEILAKRVSSHYVVLLLVAVAHRRCPLHWLDINITCTYLITRYSAESALTLTLVLEHSWSQFYSHWSSSYKSCICVIYLVICKQALHYTWSKLISFAFKAKLLKNSGHPLFLPFSLKN